MQMRSIECVESFHSPIICKIAHTLTEFRGQRAKSSSSLFKITFFMFISIIMATKSIEMCHLELGNFESPKKVEDIQTSNSNHTSFILDMDINHTTVANPRDNIIMMTRNNEDRQADLSDELMQDDVEIDDGDDGDDDEDDEEFYRRNPVGPLEFNLDDIEEPQQNDTNDTQGESFDDFDDFEALDLNSFYGQPKRVESKPGLAKIKLESASNKTQDAAARRKVAEATIRASKIQDIKKNGEKRGSRDEEGAKRKKFKKRKGRRTNKQTGEHRQWSSAASEASYSGLTAGGSSNGNRCAMPLESSSVFGCLTYNMVEWALRRARRILSGQIRLSSGSTMTRPPSEVTINSLGEYIELATRLLAYRYRLSQDEVSLGLEQIDTRRTSLWPMCPRFYQAAALSPMDQATRARGSLCNSRLMDSQNVAPVGRFRTHSGRCNNPLNAQLGASYMPFVRMLEPAYADSIGLPRGSGPGRASSLPPARLVSLILHPELPGTASSDLSAMFANWGQLINHDLASASPGRDSTGHEGSCCKLLRSGKLSSASLIGMTNSSPLSRICFPIELNPDDPVYGPYGLRCHEFKRSIAALRPGCSLGPRSQVNQVTSFLDGSFVYGPSSEYSRSLRSDSRGAGQLSMWNYFRRQQLKPLLPPQVSQPNEDCLARPQGLYCFRSGDLRTNQHLPLVVLHTVHARQHNRLAQALETINPHWSSDRIYHEARHIHVAMIQHIVYNEYLPTLLGTKSGILEKFKLLLQPADTDPYWDRYDANINPSISQEFAAAAFRQGHSSVPSVVFRLASSFSSSSNREPIRAYPLRQLFRQPWPLFEPWAVDEFMSGLLGSPAQVVDQFMSRELAGHLLQEPGDAFGMDLVAMNIQRGRDQGVADYNSFRDWCGLGRFENFEQMKKAMSNQSSELLQMLYGSVDEIDLFSGGLSEYPLDGGSQVGPTFACIIARQFQTLRFGDRFWYESSSGLHSFTPQQLQSIKQVTLSRLICTNLDRFERAPMGSETIQLFAMRLPHPVFNPRVPCESLADVDILAWQELPAQAVA